MNENNFNEGSNNNTVNQSYNGEKEDRLQSSKSKSIVSLREEDKTL